MQQTVLDITCAIFIIVPSLYVTIHYGNQKLTNVLARNNGQICPRDDIGMEWMILDDIGWDFIVLCGIGCYWMVLDVIGWYWTVLECI